MQSSEARRQLTGTRLINIVTGLHPALHPVGCCARDERSWRPLMSAVGQKRRF
jgi:hypothetical protein